MPNRRSGVSARPVSSASVDERANALSRLYDEVKAHVKTLVDDADPLGLLGMVRPPG